MKRGDLLSASLSDSSVSLKLDSSSSEKDFAES